MAVVRSLGQLSCKVMIRAINSNMLSATGQSLSAFVPAEPLTYAPDNMALIPPQAKLRPLLKCVPRLMSTVMQGCGLSFFFA